jgi:hypothetical protein
MRATATATEGGLEPSALLHQEIIPMLKFRNNAVIAAGCFALLMPALLAAADWMPSTAPPVAPGTLDDGAARARPVPPMPPQMPYGAPRGPMPPSLGSGPAPTGANPDYDPETGRTSFDFAGLRVTQSRTDDAYQLDIDLRGLPAEQVQIRPAGGGLILVVRRTAQTNREEAFADGRGFRRSWGYSSGQSVKRLPAPPDADLRAMQREDTAASIHVSIPRMDLPTDGGRPGFPLPPAQTAPEAMQ